jgi:LPXTG-motif cell wall-anchored protein
VTAAVVDLPITGPAVVVTNPPAVLTIPSVQPAVLDARAVAGPLQLPSTGTDAGTTAAIAATLVASGAALVALRRRPA